MANIIIALALIMSPVITGIVLALGAVGYTMGLGQIYDRESNRNYAAAARDRLQEEQAETEKQLAAARAEGDEIAEAEAEVLLATLDLVEERYNPAAVWRQEEQQTAAFREDQWRQYKVGLLLKGLGTVPGKLGFGKVRGSYIRGINWPPDPSKSAAIWDPKAGQAIRIMLQSDRPILKVTEFSDDLADFLTILSSSYSVATSATQSEDQEAMTGEEVYGAVKEALERIEDLELLPDTLGVFIGASLIKQAMADNPQIATLSPEEQAEFLTDQACKQLQALMQAESDVDRGEVLQATERALGCAGAVAEPGDEEPEGDEPPPEEVPEEEQPPEEQAPSVEIPEEKSVVEEEMVYECTWSNSYGKSGDCKFYVNENNGGVYFSFGLTGVSGTHENGEFVLPFNDYFSVTGTFSEESVSGSGSNENASFEFSGTRVR